MAEITSTAGLSHAETIALLEAVLVDLTALKAAHDTLIAKLNLDSGITDTDYAVTAALTVTT